MISARGAGTCAYFKHQGARIPGKVVLCDLCAMYHLSTRSHSKSTNGFHYWVVLWSAPGATAVLEWYWHNTLKGYLLICGGYARCLLVGFDFNFYFLKCIFVASGINLVPDAFSTLSFLGCIFWCYRSSKLENNSKEMYSE